MPSLRRLSADLLFDGFDVHYGFSTPNPLEAKVNRVIVEVIKSTVALCDSSKFGHRSLSNRPASALQEVIPDRGAPKSDLSVLKQARIGVNSMKPPAKAHPPDEGIVLEERIWEGKISGAALSAPG